MKAAGPAVGLSLLCGLLLQACGANDVPFNLEIKNNTSVAVIVRACNGYGPSCDSAAYTLALQPGRSAASGQDPDGIFRPMMVTSQGGATLGCLPFQFDQITPASTVVKITQRVPCGHSLGSKASDGQNWPYRKY